MIFLHKFWGEDLVMGFPCVVCLGVTLPFDQILQSFDAPIMAVACDGFHFIFFFPLHEVRWWFHKVDPVLIGLLIGVQKRCMKHIVDCPGRGELELISDW
jgi:hypothetical protein